MALIQVPLEVPEAIYAGLMSGELIRRGGVVRDHAGKIVTHLREAAIVDDDGKAAAAQKAATLVKQNKDLLKQNDQLAKRAADLAKQNKIILIGIGVVVVIAAAGGAIAHVVKTRAEKGQSESLSEEEASFNRAMQSYLGSLKNGNLNRKALDEVLSNIETVKEGIDGGTLSIDFDNGQLDALVMVLKDYTERLAIANKFKLAEPPAQMKSDGSHNIILLSHYLREQRRIMNAA